MTVHRTIGWRTSILYGIGALASAAKTVPVTTFLMLYYNQVVGLSALAVSTVLMVSLIFDALFDPLIGQISDNHRSRLGRRLPFMYASALPITLLFIFLWIPPAGWSQWAQAAYLAVCIIGLRFFDTFFELPHVALIPELTSDYHERTKLFTLRYLFEAAGGVIVTALAYNVFMKEEPDGTGGLLAPGGYATFAWVTGLIIFTTLLTSTIGLHRKLARPVLPAAENRPIKGQFKEMAATLNSRSFAALAAAAIFISIGSGIGSSLSTYWLLYFYQFTQTQMTILTVPIALGMLVLTVTPPITRRLGKRDAAILFCWIYVIVVAAPLVARLLDLIPAKSIVLLVLVGTQAVVGAASVTMVLIALSSMISDLVEEAEVRTGRRSEGLLMAAMSLVRKATIGFGTFGAGLILTAIAFPQGAERQEVPWATLADMAWIYLATKVILISLTTAMLLLYRLDRAAHEANLEILAENAGGNHPVHSIISAAGKQHPGDAGITPVRRV